MPHRNPAGFFVRKFLCGSGLEVGDLIVPNDKVQNAALAVDVPTYLPLSEAANKYNLSEESLTQLIETGKMQAVQTPSGELLVAAVNNGSESKTKQEIIAEKFAHLRGQMITATEASEKYGLPRANILTWKLRGYISVLKPGYRMELDEADIAYCAFVYHRKKEEYSGKVVGANLFDDEGNPYQVKYPDLARQRRRQNE